MLEESSAEEEEEAESPRVFLSQYNYAIHSNNNPSLVLRILSYRPWWRFCEDEKSPEGMFSSIYSYMKSENRDPYEFIPWTIIVNDRSKRALRDMLKKRFHYYQNRCRLCGNRIDRPSYKPKWTTKSSAPPTKETRVIESLKSRFAVRSQANFFSHSQCCATVAVASSVSSDEIASDSDEVYVLENSKLVPKSKQPIDKNCLPRFELDALELTSPTSPINEVEEKSRCRCSIPVRYKNIWLFKPTDGKQGKNIELCADIATLLHFSEENSVIQKYIENPHLYNLRKYDIRAFALLCNSADNTRLLGYTYQVLLAAVRPPPQDCYCRTSSTPFSLSQIHEPMIHLTNDAVQRKSAKFGRFEYSNKVTMERYKAYLMKTVEGRDGLEVYKSIRQQMIDIEVNTFRAVEKTINPYHIPNCFQLLGYDFLIDDNYKVWLLEINTNPSINYDAKEQPFKEFMFPRMLEEMFELTVDKYYPPPAGCSVNCGEVKWKQGIVSWSPLVAAPELQKARDNGANRFTQIFESSPFSSACGSVPLCSPSLVSPAPVPAPAVPSASDGVALAAGVAPQLSTS